MIFVLIQCLNARVSGHFEFSRSPVDSSSDQGVTPEQRDESVTTVMTPGLVLVRFGLLGLFVSLALASPYNYIQVTTFHTTSYAE